MADVQLEIINLTTGKTVGTYSLTLCIPETFNLIVGSYRFIATYLKTDEAMQEDRDIVEGENPSLTFEFLPAVGKTTENTATSKPFQRKSFYANGLFWVFFSDGTDMVYSTSKDGIEWASPTTIRKCTTGSAFSIWFDGTYLHYAYASNSSIYYRRGTPNADGTISWTADEQTVSTTYDSAQYPFISVDSEGYVWISYLDYSGTDYYPYVIKSGNNDGTWGTTPEGFPYQLSTTSESWYTSIIPLTNGKMVAFYTYGGGTVRARRWNGTAWGDERATASAVSSGDYHSVVAEGDDAHLVFLSTSYNILYVRYRYDDDDFGAESTVQAGVTSTSAPVLCRNPSTSTLYCFWAGSPSADHVYFKRCVGGVWDTDPTEWFGETDKLLTENDRLTCSYNAYSKADVELEVINLETEESVGKFSLAICQSRVLRLTPGSYRFTATYLKTGDFHQKDMDIISGENPPWDFEFTPAGFTFRNYAGLVYMTRTESPFHARHRYLTLIPTVNRMTMMMHSAL